MDRIVDFSNCKRAHASFGGTDRKFGVVYNGEIYMLKFSENHAKRHDISTSYVNNAISEYVSSHIAQSTGLSVHETVLGTYNDEVVVGCKDFRGSNNISNIEFSEYVRAKYDSREVKRFIRLDQIYSTLQDPANDIPLSLQKASIERYWDTFVIDALVGNFDRHMGNWGYLSENNRLRLAPIYDFGSTLFPQLSDQGTLEISSSEYELLKRCLVFPSPSLVITDEKVGKVGYYDMLASNYDPNCTAAVLRMVPRINIEKVCQIIDETPFITDVRKEFYKIILKTRKNLLLNRAYLRCFYGEYDLESLNRLKNGKQFSEDDLNTFIQTRRASSQAFQENEQKLCQPHFLIEREVLLKEQRMLMEQYGFNSTFVYSRIRDIQKSHEKRKGRGIEL